MPRIVITKRKSRDTHNPYKGKQKGASHASVSLQATTARPGPCILCLAAPLVSQAGPVGYGWPHGGGCFVSCHDLNKSRAGPARRCNKGAKRSHDLEAADKATISFLPFLPFCLIALLAPPSLLPVSLEISSAPLLLLYLWAAHHDGELLVYTELAPALLRETGPNNGPEWQEQTGKRDKRYSGHSMGEASRTERTTQCRRAPTGKREMEVSRPAPVHARPNCTHKMSLFLSAFLLLTLL